MAQVIKTMVCLANSRKLSGRCVAGRELNDGRPRDWIRPVSNREHEEVSEYERQYQDGSDPKLLDIISVPLIEPKPKSCQSENWLLDPDYYWVKRGEAKWGDLEQLADPVTDLWTNGLSTFHGRNDKIEIATANTLDHSLRLLRLSDLQISVFVPGAAFGESKRRVQARFQFNHQQYRLWVTDPNYERRFLKTENGDYEIGECYATISIGEPHEGYCYKLVAAIIEPL